MSDTPSAETAAPTEEGPYVGLRHYTEGDADRFFGRDAECAVIIGNLRASRLTLLYAESGVGKSSLIRAGVAARLRRHAEVDRTARRRARFLPIVFSSWSEDPQSALIRAVEQGVKPLVPAGARVSLPRESLSAALEAASARVDVTVLVLLDQFEELFLYHSGERRAVFADAVAECINGRNPAPSFLIAIRQDAYAALGDLFAGRVANIYANHLHLEYLHREGAREAIEQPVARWRERRGRDVVVEPALVEAVLDGVRLRHVAASNGRVRAPVGHADDSDAIEATYLQLVMKRLWDEEAAAGSHVLRLETLERLGGAETIIAGHLDRVMAQLPGDDQDAAASVFRFLVTRNGTKIALTTKDLAELSGVPEERTAGILRRLAAADMHILRPVTVRDASRDGSYEIFHDALARPIVDWRTRYRERREVARREQLAARLGRERRRRRLAVAALVVSVTLLLVTAVAFALVQRRNSERLTKVNTSIAIAGRLADLASDPTTGPVVNALAGLEAFRVSPTFDAQRQSVIPLQRNPGLPRILVGHARAVWSVASSPGPRGLIATGGADASIRFWTRDGHPIGRPLRFPVGTIVTGLALRADRRMLAAVREDGTVALWSLARVERPRVVRTLAAGRGGAGCQTTSGACQPVSFSPDGTLLAWGGTDGSIRIWAVPRHDPRRARLRQRTTGPLGGVIHGLAFSRDGRRIAVASERGVVVLRVAQDGQRLRVGRVLERGRAAYAVAWADDRRLAAAIGTHIVLWTRRRRATPVLHASDTVYALAFPSDGRSLVSAGADDYVTTWDLRRGLRTGPPRPHDDDVLAIAVEPGGRGVVAGDFASLVKIWPLHPARAPAATVAGVRNTDDIALGSPRLLATAAYSNTPGSGPVRIWRLPAGAAHPAGARLVDRLPGSAPIAYHGHTLVAGNPSRRTFTLWDTGRACRSEAPRRCQLDRPAIRPQDGYLQDVAFDKSGRHLASGTTSGTLALWDASDRRHLRLIARTHQRGGTVERVAFSPSHSKLLATAADDGAVRLWRVTGDRSRPLAALGRPLRAPGSNAELFAMAFSPDGTLLAAGGADQTVNFWNVQEPSRPRLLPGHLYQTNSFLAVAFSPDGRTLVAGDADGSACPYDVRSRRILSTDRCLAGPIAGSIDVVAFDPAGQLLFSGGRQEPVIAWSRPLWSTERSAATLADLRANVCAITGRNLTTNEWNEIFTGTELAGHPRRTCSK